MRKGLLKRLPLTFLPFVNQQLREWDFLFPNERQSVERLLLYVASLDPEQSAALFRDVVQLEEKMGVRHWQFSTTEQTIQNSSLLARSPYFQDWRRAVQAVFDAADQHALKTNGAAAKSGNRLVLLDIPQLSPRRCGERLAPVAGNRPAPETRSRSVRRAPQSFGISSRRHTQRGRWAFRQDCWMLPGAVPAPRLRTPGLWTLEAAWSIRAREAGTFRHGRSHGYLAQLWEAGLATGENFSHEMNTMRKDLADADAVFDHLRKVDVTPWCPPEVAADPAVREFLRSLYLSGNGAVIFGNSFVEWASSEAFRRARPSFLAAQFGIAQ